MKKLATLFLLILLVGIEAVAQPSGNIVMVFESSPGTRPTLGLQSAQGGMSGFSRLLDVTGDGEPELVLTNEDNEGNLVDLIALDLKEGNDTTYKILDVAQTLGLAERDGMKFFGFADVDGDETNEVIFANGRDVWLVNPSDNSTEWTYSVQIPSDFPVLLRAVTDITDDSFPDIVIFLPQQRQTQVWGLRQ